MSSPQERNHTEKHLVVFQQEWLIARKALLAKEKEATHLRDRINADRLALPWAKVEKNFAFDTRSVG